MNVACVSPKSTYLPFSKGNCQGNSSNTVCTSTAVARSQLQNNQGEYEIEGPARKKQKSPNVKSDALKMMAELLLKMPQ